MYNSAGSPVKCCFAHCIGAGVCFSAYALRYNVFFLQGSYLHSRFNKIDVWGKAAGWCGGGTQEYHFCNPYLT